MYGLLDLDVTEAERWWRAQPGVSATHVVGAAVGRALVECPDANTRLVAGRARQRPDVDVSFAVSIQDGDHLQAVCVRGADSLDPREIAAELSAGLRNVVRSDNAPFQRAVRAADALPGWLVRPGLWLVGLLTAGFGWSLPLLRVEPHPFGSALVTSVGELGIEQGLAPVLPFARLGLVVAIGSVDWRPRVVDGDVVARRTLMLGVTIDHRLVDGAQAAQFTGALSAAIERPWLP